jgi:hypothetical protein
MITFPLSLMALSYYTIFAGFEDESRLMWAGFCGVLGVNCVAIGFGLFAYYDNGGDADEEESLAGDSAEAMEAKRKTWSKWEQEQAAQESLEDQERLAMIRKKRDELAGLKPEEQDAAPSSSANDAETEPAEAPKRSIRSRSAKKDSALSDAVEEPEALSAGAGRSTRSRSKKA